MRSEHAQQRRLERRHHKHDREDVHDRDPVRQGHVSAFLFTPSVGARESFASQLCLPTALTHGLSASSLCLCLCFCLCEKITTHSRVRTRSACTSLCLPNTEPKTASIATSAVALKDCPLVRLSQHHRNSSRIPVLDIVSRRTRHPPKHAFRIKPNSATSLDRMHSTPFPYLFSLSAHPCVSADPGTRPAVRHFNARGDRTVTSSSGGQLFQRPPQSVVSSAQLLRNVSAHCPVHKHTVVGV